MQRLILFCIAVACAAILIGPLAAQQKEPTPEPSATSVELIDTQALSGIAADLESRVEKAVLGSQIPALHHAFNAVTGVLKFEIFGLSVGTLLLSFLILFLSILLRNVLSKAILGRIVNFARRKEAIDARWALVLTKPLSFFLLLAGIYISL
ncbi:MAG: hypothetical protein ACO3XN_10715, partial [Chthoniobacterales bacterium]